MLGISTDARPTQTAYSASLGNIPYPILADFHPKGDMSRKYGLYNESRGTANRAIVIIDKQGVVRFKEVYAAATDLRTEDILAEIEKL